MIAIGDKVYSQLGSKKTVIDENKNFYIVADDEDMFKSIFGRNQIFVNQYILYLREVLYKKITNFIKDVSIIDRITYFDAKKSMYDEIDFKEIKGCDKIV